MTARHRNGTAAATWPSALRGSRVLVIGYGNIGRLDDGLGIACAERLDALGLPDVTVDVDYQLTVEHAETVSRHDHVIFVDASVDGPEPFMFAPLEAHDERTVSYTSHHLEPGAVLALARDLFAADCPAYFLAIRGYEFDEFGETLSAGALSNLEAATQFLKRALQDGHGAMAEADPPTRQDPAAVTADRQGSS